MSIFLSQKRFMKSLFLMLVLSVNLYAASPGTLDPTFGERGIVVIDMGSSDSAFASVIQPDGKIILVGGSFNSATDFSLIRLNADGSLDTTFGTNGKVYTDFNNEEEAAHSVALLPDNKILVAGSNSNGQNATGFKLARYNPNGSLDTTFGTGGKINSLFPNNVKAIVNQMILQPDGKIVVVGRSQMNNALLARFNPNGSLDTTFGTGGQVSSQIYVGEGVVISQTADGKYIVAGGADSGAAIKVLRFNANGGLDMNFGTNGQVTTQFSIEGAPYIHAAALSILPDGDFLVAGKSQDTYTIYEPALVKYNSDGTLDDTFILNDRVLGNCGCTSRVSKIILLGDGRFYTAGNFGASITRYLSNGAIDNSFGFRGTATVQFSTYIYDASLQPDGKLILTGSNGNDFVAYRVRTTLLPPAVRGDFDGDGKTDFAVWRPSNGYWYWLNSSNGSISAEQFGINGDYPLPQDYNSDGKTDLTIYRPSNNSGFFNPSQPGGGSVQRFYFGLPSEIRLPEDYDGDGRADRAIFQPSTQTWQRSFSSRGGQFQGTEFENVVFGIAGDKPVPADFDGDGRADIAMFRPSSGTWLIQQSLTGTVRTVQWGISTDIPVPSDYDGDGKADIAVFREGNWYVLRSADNSFFAAAWGVGTDKPVAGDYDGDGKTDVAVFRPSTGGWYVLKSSDSSFLIQQWGVTEDIPVPFAYLP